MLKAQSRGLNPRRSWDMFIAECLANRVVTGCYAGRVKGGKHQGNGKVSCSSAFPAQHLRPSGVLGCWRDGLELSTYSRILSGIQRAAQTVLGVYLKRTCSRVTAASSALGVLDDYALYKSTHSLTHFLTLMRSAYIRISPSARGLM